MALLAAIHLIRVNRKRYYYRVKLPKEDGIWSVIAHARGGSFSLLLIVIGVALFGELVFWIYGMLRK